MLLLFLGLSNPARAQCEAEKTALNSCWDAVGACNQVVKAKDKEISLCQLGLVQTLDHAAMLDLELKDTQDKLQSWYRNPFVMVALGLIVGGVAVGAAIK